MKKFDLFLSEQSPEISEIIMHIDELLLSYPNVTRKIRYKIPFYDYGSWICYINPYKKLLLVELVFLKGKELSEIFPFLETRDRKMVAGMFIKSINEETIQKAAMAFEEAMILSYK